MRHIQVWLLLLDLKILLFKVGLDVADHNLLSYIGVAGSSSSLTLLDDVLLNLTEGLLKLLLSFVSLYLLILEFVLVALIAYLQKILYLLRNVFCLL